MHLLACIEHQFQSTLRALYTQVRGYDVETAPMPIFLRMKLYHIAKWPVTGPAALTQMEAQSVYLESGLDHDLGCLYIVVQV